MLKHLFLFCLLAVPAISHAQSIFSALHANETREYRFGKPLEIKETNTSYTSGGVGVDKNVKIFDSAGMLLTETRYNSEGEVMVKLASVNDQVRHLLLQRTIETWSKAGYIKDSAIYIYDDRSFLIQVQRFNKKGNCTSISKIVNNEKGDPVELDLYDGAGRSYGVETAEYIYDKNMLIVSVHSNDGRVLSTDTLKIDFKKPSPITGPGILNDHGDEIAYTRKEFNGTRTFYEAEYTYDTAGNIVDEKIYKVFVKRNGKKKRDLDRRYQKEILYRTE